jgi:hypothetical protein
MFLSAPLRLRRDGTLPDFLTAESLDKNILLIEKLKKKLFGWLGERRPSPQYGYRSRPPHHWDYSPAADNFKWNLVKVKLKTIIPPIILRKNFATQQYIVCLVLFETSTVCLKSKRNIGKWVMSILSVELCIANLFGLENLCHYRRKIRLIKGNAKYHYKTVDL